MAILGDLYTEFSRIDLDTRGGYARVARVRTHGQQDLPEYCAFKLMRPEIGYRKAFEHFEDELKLLVNITNDANAPSAITRIHDCGFVPVELSQSLHEGKEPDLNREIISIGISTKDFFYRLSELQKKEVDLWLPYLVVDLAAYDDSLFRQVHNHPIEDPSGLFRLPTGEVIAMAFQLMEVIDYLRDKQRRIYMDWKPEHIFWNGLKKQVKLVDWNVTVNLEDGPGEGQNARDDLRIFCGAVLYIGLTFIDPDGQSMPIGPHPTTEFQSPVHQIRRRYWTDNPEFYERGITLDDKIKQIIRKGLDPKQGFESTEELRIALMNYAQNELGLLEGDLDSASGPLSPYFMALAETRLAQQNLLQAQQHLIKATQIYNDSIEFNRHFDVIRSALKHFPGS